MDPGDYTMQEEREDELYVTYSPEPEDVQIDPEELQPYEVGPVNIKEMVSAILAAIDSLDEQLEDDSLEAMGVVLDEHMVISAFDLLDRANVIKYVAPWGKVDYEVLGASATHFIQIGLPSRIPWYCSCSAYHRTVLRDKSHVLCKHILATLLATKLSVTMERPITADELLEIFQKHFNSH